MPKGTAVPNWLLLHPMGDAAAAGVSLEKGDIYPLTLVKAPGPIMGLLEPPPAIWLVKTSQAQSWAQDLAVEPHLPLGLNLPFHH